MDKVRNKLQDKVSFISRYLPLVNSHMVEFFSNNLWDAYVPNKIRTEFKENNWDKGNIVNTFVENLTSNTTELGKFLLSCSANSLDNNEVIISIDELRKNLSINKCSNMDCASKDKFMSEKKFHEVTKMGELVADLVMATDATHIIDIGDGKGYLSSYLSLVYKLQVLGLDSSINLTQGAAQRAVKLQKQWNSALNKFNVNNEPFNDVTPSKIKSNKLNTKVDNQRYKQATKFITRDTDLKNLLYENFPDSIEYQFGLIGLHTCGNLSPICLRQFLYNNNAPFLVNIGCCYHLLEEGDDHDSTFPMSNYLKQSNFTLGRNARMLSLQAPARIFISKKIPQTLMFRAVFESFMEHKMGKCIGKGREVGRIGSKCSSFVEYSRKGFKKLGYDIDVTDEEIDAFFDKYAPSLQFLEFYFMMRVVLAPVIENIILLDRLLFLQESGINNSFLVKLFDSYV